MSVIQKIRDKYARWAVIAIGLSLVGFILMDAFANRGGMLNSGRSTTLGKINGTKIDYTSFNRQMEILGAGVQDEQRASLIQNLWEFQVSNTIITDEAKKLGLTVTEKEMRDALYGSNPPQFIAQYFTDPNTGKFDGLTAQQQINQLLKKGAAGQQDFDYFTTNIEIAKNQRLVNKYFTLMANSIYYPKWLLEKRNVDNSLAAKMSYLMVPYTSIADSTIKISDEEIRDYLEDNEDEFRKEKETRSIEYVLFSTSPSSADSAAIKQQVDELKPQFASASEPGAFVNQQSSAIPYGDIYYPRSVIQVPAKDSIFATPVGGVYGPYLDVNNYVLAKVIGVRSLPDSVKSRHILIGTVNPRTGQATLADSVAKVRADSIAAAIRNGANFDSLALKFSDDDGSKQNGGVYTMSSTDIQSQLVKEFGNFILFDGKPGDKKVVKTQFGWHYIEVVSHMNVEPHYKVAYLAKTIQPSPETESQMENQAAMFAGDARDYKSFNAYYEKNLKPKGFNKQIAADIDEMQFGLVGVTGTAREFIKEVFKADKGDIIGPTHINQNFVVAVVTEENKPGLPDVSQTRIMIEPMLRNRKKAEIIAKNIGQVTTLEQVASKTQQTIQTVDSIRLNGGMAFGYEPKVLGAVFNPANKGKVVTQPIEGMSGVFVIRVDNTFTVPVEAADIEMQRTQMQVQAKQQLMQQMQYGVNPIIDPLRKRAKIKDYRAEFY